MPEQVDILVVGAGPAGSLAAKAAADAGASVLIIDKKRRIGAMPHCAEFVPRLLAAEVDISDRAKVQSVQGMETRLTGEQAGFMNGPGWILDRQVFDHDLARQAAQAGARIWAGSSLIQRASDLWVVKRSGRRMEIRAGCVVAADGASSITARILGLGKPDLLVGRQVEVILKQPLERTLVWLEQRFTGGYAWLFPKHATANLGLGVRPSAKAKALLEDLRAELIQAGLIAPGVLAITGGAIAISGPMRPPYSSEVLFCGDAAGLTHPITGAGIPQAVFSGHDAGKAAAALASGQAEAGDQYAHELNLRYGRYLQRGLEARSQWDTRWQEPDFTGLMHDTWPAWTNHAR